MTGRALAIIAAVIGAVVLFALIAFIAIARPYRIPSSAMEPTLHCSRPDPGCEGQHQDRILVLKFLDYGRGDVVVFHVPDRAKTVCGAGGVFVKRIVGVPGDTWEERNGRVYVNGTRLSEPYVEAKRRDTRTYRAREIPEGRYFLLGDNRDASCDSRLWGTVPRSRIIGKVFAVYWPLGRIQTL